MNGDEKVNIGIIGLGWPGLRHFEGVLANPEARLLAAADASEERRKEWDRQFPGASLYPDYSELLRDPAVDAVVICLPNFLHFPATIAALRAGKHVLCEKPPTLNREEMRRIKEESERNGLVYAFGRQTRFHGRMRVARELVKSGRLGQIYYARTQWVRSRGIPVGVGGWFLDRSKAGGGALIDIGIHALDAAWFLMGCPRPQTVSAKVSTNFRSLVPANQLFDVDDSGSGFIRFDNGAVLHLEVSWAGNLPDDVPEKAPGKRERHQTVIYGQKASLRVEPLTLYEDQGGKLVDLPLEAEAGNGFAEQMADFVRAVSTGGVPTNDARQGLYLMEMLDAMYESSATGHEVLIPD
jgi:predicted dehydrogenase